MATRVLPCLIWMQHYDVKKQLLRDIDEAELQIKDLRVNLVSVRL